MAESTIDPASEEAPARLAFGDGPDGGVLVTLAGDWLLGVPLPRLDAVLGRLRGSPAAAAVRFETDALGRWDSGLVTRLLEMRSAAVEGKVTFDESGLPEGAARLIAMATAVAERPGARRDPMARGVVEQLGDATVAFWRDTLDLVRFIGDLVLSFGRLVRGRATYLPQHVFVYVQEAGAEALPIVALISALLGMIFAFVGVMQLNTFGAGIYTADLVAVAMVREIAPIMTAIIMAGRTGAAYAAEIGTMKVNEEVDALTTLGIDATDFLVLPRVLALVLMMPLLTVFSSLSGILGGLLVGLSMLEVSLVQYTEQTFASVPLGYLFGGLFKSLVYGSLVAVAGCLQGMACGNSAMAVGVATTRAVVMGIVLIVVSAAALTVIYINLGI